MPDFDPKRWYPRGTLDVGIPLERPRGADLREYEVACSECRTTYRYTTLGKFSLSDAKSKLLFTGWTVSESVSDPVFTCPKCQEKLPSSVKRVR